MTDTYTKLFSSITASTIWQEPDGTRLTWITMLAMAKKDGCVYGSVPGLAHQANVSLDAVKAALACFLAPDPYSRTKDFEGRRIEEIDGGWRLLNHEKFRQIRSAEERREYMREYMRKKRAEAKAEPVLADSLAKSTDVAPPAPALSVEQKKERDTRARGTRLSEDWSPSEKLLQWAASARPDVDPILETETFRNFWTAKPDNATKLNWDSTWRNWILKSKPSRRSEGTPSKTRTKLDIAQRMKHERGSDDPESTTAPRLLGSGGNAGR